MHRSKLAYNYFLKLTELKGIVVKDPKCPEPASPLREGFTHFTIPLLCQESSSGHYDLSLVSSGLPLTWDTMHRDPSQPRPGWSCSLGTAPSLCPGGFQEHHTCHIHLCSTIPLSAKGIVSEQGHESTLDRTSENRLSGDYTGIYTGKRKSPVQDERCLSTQYQHNPQCKFSPKCVPAFIQRSLFHFQCPKKEIHSSTWSGKV